MSLHDSFGRPFEGIAIVNPTMSEDCCCCCTMIFTTQTTTCCCRNKDSIRRRRYSCIAIGSRFFLRNEQQRCNFLERVQSSTQESIQAIRGMQLFTPSSSHAAITTIEWFILFHSWSNGTHVHTNFYQNRINDVTANKDTSLPRSSSRKTMLVYLQTTPPKKILTMMKPHQKLMVINGTNYSSLFSTCP